jgi:hypothetical protein
MIESEQSRLIMTHVWLSHSASFRFTLDVTERSYDFQRPSPPFL